MFFSFMIKAVFGERLVCLIRSLVKGNFHAGFCSSEETFTSTIISSCPGVEKDSKGLAVRQLI
jgi:hypothetical protein